MSKENTSLYDDFKCICKDEIDFKKKLRSLKKYCPIAYKYFLFDFKNICEVENGCYEHTLPTSKEIKAIYGEIKVKYIIDNNSLTLLDIEPAQFLLDGYITDLKVYEGVPYRNEQDKFKIKLFNLMKGMCER